MKTVYGVEAWYYPHDASSRERLSYWAEHSDAERVADHVKTIFGNLGRTDVQVVACDGEELEEGVVVGGKVEEGDFTRATERVEQIIRDKIQPAMLEQSQKVTSAFALMPASLIEAHIKRDSGFF